MDPRSERCPSEPARRVAASVAAWVGAGGEALAAALAGDHATELEAEWGWNIVALGGDRRAAAGAWAARTGAAEAASLREMARPGVTSVLVVGRDAPSDDELRLLLEGDRAVLLGLGQAVSLATATRLGERIGRLMHVPSMRYSASRRAAAPLLEEFLSEGPITALTVRIRCRPGERTVDAMLADACAVCTDLLDAPESVVALGRVPSEAGEPRSLVAIVRTSLGALAAIDLADGGGWLREVEVVGMPGRIRLTDTSLTCWDRQGERTENTAIHGSTDVVSAAVESLREIARLRPAREDRERALAPPALAEAARLSARTGNAESPARMHDLAARP